MHHKNMISIWFFIGVLLLFYGVVIFAEGIYQYLNPPANPVVLANLHAGIWWGAILILMGGWYTSHFSPKRTRNE